MKYDWLFFLILFWVSISAVSAMEQDAYPFRSQADAKRFQSLTEEIRCVVCQNQSLADSNAPLAKDLREKIYRMVLNQKTNHEIKSYLTKRYGEFILLNPRLNKLTVLLWIFPFAGLLVGLLSLFKQRQRL